MSGIARKLMGVTKGDDVDPDLVLVFDTTLATGTTVTVPLAGTVDVVIDWGDGTSEAFTTTGNKTHTYAAEGEYTVRVSGSLTGFGSTASRPNLTKCLSFGDLGLEFLTTAFRNCVNLTEVPDALPSSVTNINGMFFSATSFNQNIGGWDVSSVTIMSSAFRGATSFNNGGSADINNWDTSSVTSMSFMFLAANSFNQNIGGWDVSSVTTMASMFSGANSFNQNIGGWAMGAVTSANDMFRNTSAFNQDLSGITTGLAAQPFRFSLDANATFADNANGLKPFLADGVTQINT
jgi:surface protein